MSCGTPIAWRDNVPLLSWLRSCAAAAATAAASIPWRYPAVELATALLVAGCVLAFGLTLDALVAAFFCAVLVVVSATDLEHRIIPNRVVVPAAAVVLVAQTAAAPEPGVGARRRSAPRRSSSLAALVYPAGHGHGRRQARAAAGRDARPDRPGGADGSG